MIAAILWLGFSGRINLWLVPLKTIAGISIFALLIVLTQLTFSSEKIKSKLARMILYDLLLLILVFCFLMVISEWTNLSEDVYGYIAFVISIIASLLLSFYYYQKHKNTEIKEWLIKSSKTLLFISVGFTAIFLLSYLILKMIENKTDFFIVSLGFGSMISLYAGVTIFLWILGTYLLIKIKIN
jgi:hypothetical protein